ncbi:hypothetical protein HK096_007264, partial [Nowakowskiella sp. JEL0078]
MLSLLKSGDIDIAVALTEGLLAASLNGNKSFKLIGTYVDSPLTWGVSTHPSKKSLDESFNAFSASEEDLRTRWPVLKNARIGVSRFGSGSHLIPFVMADSLGWLENKDDKPFEFVVNRDIDGLKTAIGNKETDAFLWERFTTK